MILSDWINLKNSAFRQSAMLFAFMGIVGFLLVVLNAKLLPVFFLLVGLGLFLLDKKLLLMVLYIIYLPTNGLIDRADFLGGVLGIQQILGVLVLVSIFKLKVAPSPTSELQRMASRLMILLLVYLSYTFTKNAVFGLFDSGMADTIKKIVNMLLLYGPLVLVLRKCASNTIQGWVAIGAFLGVLNQVVYCYLSPVLPTLGFYSLGTEAFFSQGTGEGVSRYVGVMGNGDSNTLGAFFVIAIGFFLSRASSFNRSLLIKGLAGLCVMAIALTGSRTAFLSLLIIGIMFIGQRGSSKARVQLLLGALLVAAISSPLWDALLVRLSGAGEEQFATNTSGNRIGKWLLYFQHFIDHPLTFVSGSSQAILIGFQDVFIAAHNFYIQVIYNAGLGFLALFFLQYFKLVKLSLQKVTQYKISYILLPFFAITFFVSDYGIFMYFCIFLALNTTRLKKPENDWAPIGAA